MWRDTCEKNSSDLKHCRHQNDELIELLSDKLYVDACPLTDYVVIDLLAFLKTEIKAFVHVPGQLQVVIDAQDKFYVNSCNTLQFNL